jgi:hypothetical protein
MNGKQVLFKKLKKGVSEIPIKLACGIYMVQLNIANYSVYEKISVAK